MAMDVISCSPRAWRSCHPGMLKQVDRIRTNAAKVRELANAEKAGLAEQLNNLELRFVAKAGEGVNCLALSRSK